MKIEIYRREDSKYAFRVKAANGQIIGTDGGQGYENFADAMSTVRLLTGFHSREDVSFEIIPDAAP